jgi:hypothetical protein
MALVASSALRPTTQNSDPLPSSLNIKHTVRLFTLQQTYMVKVSFLSPTPHPRALRSQGAETYGAQTRRLQDILPVCESNC